MSAEMLYMYICVYILFITLFGSHYFVNGGFFEEDDYILNNVDKLSHIPCTIVQGRYDCITPMRTAWELHKASQYIIINTHIMYMYFFCSIETAQFRATHYTKSRPCCYCGTKRCFSSDTSY